MSLQSEFPIQTNIPYGPFFSRSQEITKWGPFVAASALQWSFDRTSLT